jgi:beta-lactamase superfamily II metal-dependent hydrolase
MPLRIHFLNVGHGDCTFVELPSGRLMMIDINNSKSLPETDVKALASHQGLSTFAFRSTRRMVAGQYRSWEDYYRSLLVDPAEYYARHFRGRGIFRYIQTHPDMDHMTGLHRFFWQDRVPLANFWDVRHGKTMTKGELDDSPYNWADWRTYERLRQGIGPDDKHKVLHNLRGATGNLWTEDDIEILSPTQDLIDDCDNDGEYNDCSYVLKLSHAGRTIILPGDAGDAAWESILAKPGPDEILCDILKASHHGRESGYHEEAIDAMAPEVVICSVGKKPNTDASDEYQSHGATVLSTRYHGTIVVTIEDDGDIEIVNHEGELIEGL